MKIDKSAEMRKKEARIQELEKQLKRTRSTLKGLKTRLSNTRERVEEIQRDIHNKASRLQERLLRCRERLEQLIEKVRKDKRLGEQEKEKIEELYFGFVGYEEMPGFEEAAAEYTREWEEEGQSARFRDAFREFRVEPPKDVQRDIRKLYLSLSKQFHPDRARSEKEAEQFHLLQQQLNEAYARHDIQELIQLEQIWGETGSETAPEKGFTIDALDARASRLEHQLALLEQQKERLSQEIKNLRQSDMGQMLTDVDSMARAGYSIEEGMGLAQLEPTVEMVEAFEAALDDTLKRGIFSPLLDDLIEELMATVSPLEEMISEMMGFEEEEEDIFGMGWPGEEEDFVPNPRPRYPPGTFVRIVKDVTEDYFDESNHFNSFSLKGFTGLVSEALVDVDDGTPVYHIMLDSASMEKIPTPYIAQLGASFHVMEMLEERELALEKRRSPEPGDSVRNTYRRLLYENVFAKLPEKQEQRLKSILLAHPTESDEANWIHYLEQQLPFPFDALTRGEYSDWAPGRPATVLKYGGFSPEYGLVVLARVGRQEDFVPLAEFYGPKGSKAHVVLKDYVVWYELAF